MKRYGVIDLKEGVNWSCNYSYPGYTMEELETELLPQWKHEAEVFGSDLYHITGDLAIGPAIVADLIARIKELEAQVATQDTETKTEIPDSQS